MSSSGIQKLFCGIFSAFTCSFDEFVGEKVVSLSYSSAVLDRLPSFPLTLYHACLCSFYHSLLMNQHKAVRNREQCCDGYQDHTNHQEQEASGRATFNPKFQIKTKNSCLSPNDDTYPTFVHPIKIQHTFIRAISDLPCSLRGIS